MNVCHGLSDWYMLVNCSFFADHCLLAPLWFNLYVSLIWLFLMLCCICLVLSVVFAAQTGDKLAKRGRVVRLAMVGQIWEINELFLCLGKAPKLVLGFYVLFKSFRHKDSTQAYFCPAKWLRRQFLGLRELKNFFFKFLFYILTESLASSTWLFY